MKHVIEFDGPQVLWPRITEIRWGWGFGEMTAFAAIEGCREADGALPWRPKAVYAVASG
jgi:hypothetical protein